MDILYIPQLDETGVAGDGGSSGRYRLLRRVPEAGVVLLTDRAVTRIELAEPTPMRLVAPPAVKGQMRDYFVRIVITADEVPEIVFAAPSGETISFEDADEDALTCEIGSNVFAFTETDEGIFMVNRKRIDIDFEVEFDPCGGTLGETKAVYKLGAQYLSLPRPVMQGMTFLGWFTEPEGGIEVDSGDRCKTGVSKLYAHWEVYVDPFAPAINPSGNLTFFTDGESGWYVDSESTARSGAIADNGSTSLRTTVAGPGVLSFRCRTSSEGHYDMLHLLCDGEVFLEKSGDWDSEWEAASREVGAGSHEFEFRYSKDGSYASGDDCAWVTDVVWTPGEGA